jgi:reverse gyrase
MHTEPWSPAIDLATNAIRYWVQIKHKGYRNPMAGVLNYYLSLSDVELDAHDKPLSLEECIKQINQARRNMKDVVANAKEQRTQFEVKLAIAIVEHNHPYLCDRNEYHPVDKENLVAKVLKTRENRKTAKRSWKKLGRQIRGIIKPETLKRSRLTEIEIPEGDEWKKVEDKEIMEEHLMERNIEQLSHAGNTPFGYSDLGAELGHTRDS